MLIYLQQAIEYYGFIDDFDTCVDLNLRMQSILVKQHVLEALSIHEEEQRLQDSLDNKKRKKFPEHLKKRQNQQYQPSSSSSDDEDDEDEDEDEESEEEQYQQQNLKPHPQQQQNIPQHKRNPSAMKDDNELQFDMDDHQTQEGFQNQQINEEELLLDNYFKKININNSNPQGLNLPQEATIDPELMSAQFQAQAQQTNQILSDSSQKFVDQQVQQLQEKQKRREFQQQLEQQQKKVNDLKKARDDEEEKQRALAAAALQKRNISISTQSNVGGNNNSNNAQQTTSSTTSKAIKFEEIEQNKEQTILLIKNEINSQSETLQERLKKRKQNLLQKQQNQQQQTNQPESESPPNMNTHTGGNLSKQASEQILINQHLNHHYLQSPNLSNILSYEQIPGGNQRDNMYSSSPVNKQGGGNSIDNSNENLTDNYILRDLEDNTSDIEPYDQGEEDGEDDDPEALQELEKRKEEIMEEFLEIAYQKKHEAIEEVKADCKKNKVPRDVEKKRILEVTQALDQKRKDGMIEIKKKLNQIIMNDSISLSDKMARLGDTETIRVFMNAYFSPQQQQQQQDNSSQEQPSQQQQPEKPQE